ncbi:MAG: hypothetical protein LBC64_10935 [Fibromonadaceae bacterium]|nr:hypothetical protein [Fibromonadaceae bacterium]
MKYIKEAVGKAKGGYVKEDPSAAAVQTGIPPALLNTPPKNSLTNLMSGKKQQAYTLPHTSKNTQTLSNAELSKQAGEEPLSEKTQAFIDVCKAAEKLGRSLKKMAIALKAIKDSEADVENFKVSVQDVSDDYDEFEKMLLAYNNTPSDKLNADDIITNVEVLHGALIRAHAIYRDHKLHPNRYQGNNEVQALLDKIIGNEQMTRNSATGRIEPVYEGLIRKFFVSAAKFLETVNKSPVNQSKQYIKAKDYVINDVLIEHGWNK